MNNKRTALAAGAILLIIVAAIKFRGSENEVDPADTATSKPAIISALPQSGVTSAIPRRKAKIEPAEPAERDFDPYEEWELTKILDHFMVPPGRFEAANMRAAIEQLGVIYAAHGGKGGLSIYERTSFDPNLAIAFDHGNISFRQLLGIIAAQARIQATIGDAGIAFEPVTAATAREIELRVPPNFTSNHVSVDLDTRDVLGTIEPDRRRAFEEYGIIFSDDVEIVADPRTATWSITGDPMEIAHVKSGVEAIAYAPPQQVFITQKLIHVEQGMTFEPQTYATDIDYQIAIRAISQMKGVDLLSSPSVVTRPGQSATVEIIREVVYPTGTDVNGQPSDFETTPTGLRIETNPILAGLDRVQLNGTSHFTTVGDQQLGDALHNQSAEAPTDVTADDFTHSITDIEGQLIEGNTALIEAAQEGDATIYQFINVRRIDPAGQPILAPPAP